MSRLLKEDRADLAAYSALIGQKGSRRAKFHAISPPLETTEFSRDLRGMVDEFATLVQLKPLADLWQEVSEKTAEWILSQLLEVDLAYRARLMERSEARSLACEFIRLVSNGETNAKNGQGCRYFTNGCIVEGPSMFTIDGKEMVGWQPATDATFDTGIIMATSRRIGLVWAEDED